MSAVFAHRGSHEFERENTVVAFRAAVALGVDGVELDVRRTGDGILVVHHDPTAGESLIAFTAAQDLPDYVPTLEAALQALEGVRVNVEIKNQKHPKEPTYDETGALERQVVDLLHDLEVASSVIVSCFDLATCARVRDYDIDIDVGWLVWDVLLDSALTQAHVLGLDAVHPYFSLVTPELAVEATELGIALNVWTVNAPEDITAMIDLGVAAVITDQPALALTLAGGR